MKRTLQAAALLLGLPAAVAAQTSTSCPDCILGLYDSSDIQKNWGYWDASGTNPFKEIFVHIDYGLDSPFSSLIGIELSISGFPSGAIPPSDEWFPPVADFSGADIRSGKTIIWGSCLVGARNLGKITMVSVSPVGADRVIRVRQRFPPTNPELPFPLLIQCDAPLNSQTSVAGGCYVLNPTDCMSFVEGCRMNHCQAVASKTWSGIKNLFR